jgi:malate synthase
VSGEYLDIREPKRNDINGILDETRAEDFDAVIVFGIKGEHVTILNSGRLDRLKTIGAFEMIRHHLVTAGRTGV